MSSLKESILPWLESSNEPLIVTLDQFECHLEKMARNIHCSLMIPLNETEFSIEQSLDIASVTFEQYLIAPAITKYGQYSLTCLMDQTSDIKSDIETLLSTMERLSNFADAWLTLANVKAASATHPEPLPLQQSLTRRPTFHYVNETN